jgi:hypothetical protein
LRLVILSHSGEKFRRLKFSSNSMGAVRTRGTKTRPLLWSNLDKALCQMRSPQQMVWGLFNDIRGPLPGSAMKRTERSAVRLLSHRS